LPCGNYGALKCSDFCEAKNFRARRRRVPPQERNDAGAGRQLGRASDYFRSASTTFISIGLEPRSTFIFKTSPTANSSRKS